MVKYKVNLKFKENGKSLNEIITEALKLEFKTSPSKDCNILKKTIFNDQSYPVSIEVDNKQ